MIVYIIRHGIAVAHDDAKATSDAERPLTADGIKKTRSAALGLRRLGARPDAFITSPYVRAAQTAEIFAEALGFSTAKIKISEAFKATGNAAEALKEIQRIRAREMACFGHAPHLDQLIAQLAGARGVFTELKKAGVACFEHTAPQGRWDLVWLLTPKVLRQLAE